MKSKFTPSLLALLASTFLSAAHAQSSATIYGIADLGVRHSNGLDAAYAGQRHQHHQPPGLPWR